LRVEEEKRCAKQFAKISDGFFGSGSRVVDLSASFAALVGPWEVHDGHNKETVGRICYTGEGVIPRPESSKQTEKSSSLAAPRIWMTTIVLEITNSQKKERNVEPEEEQEEHDS